MSRNFYCVLCVETGDRVFGGTSIHLAAEASVRGTVYGCGETRELARAQAEKRRWEQLCKSGYGCCGR